MQTTQLLSTCQALLETPTAPFQERWLASTLRGLLNGVAGLSIQQDRWGNIAARLDPPSQSPAAAAEPLVLVAHMDHPGFVLDGPKRASRLLSGTFEGRVFDEYFEGSPAVRIYRTANDPGVPGRVREYSERGGADDNRSVVIEAEEPVSEAVLAMWDVEPYALRDGLIRGRACDDLCGVAAILEALRQLASNPGALACPVIGLFTRAEETGFCGALLLASSPEREAMLPLDSAVISVEISSLRPGMSLGEGAILRVGDKAGSFDSELLGRLWGSLLGDDGMTPRLPVHRALMDGGTCEATAFIAQGYRSAGVCAPVVSYHNMIAERPGHVAAEVVSASDLQALSDMMVVFGRHLAPTTVHREQLRGRMEILADRGRRRLNPGGDASSA